MSDNPLSDKDRREINASQYELARLDQLVNSLERLGEDCTEIRARQRYLQTQLQVLKEEFFRDKP